MADLPCKSQHHNTELCNSFDLGAGILLGQIYIPISLALHFGENFKNSKVTDVYTHIMMQIFMSNY